MSFLSEKTSLRTKICGLTVPEDAEMAIQAGADALGFNFFRGSKRYLDLETAQDWISLLKGRADRVAVVVNATPKELAAIRGSGCFEFIQFHGDETPEFCATEGGENWIRAIRVKDDQSIRQAYSYQTPYLLFDAWSETGYGGTGTRLNWDHIRDFVIAAPDRKVILAGGLTPHNVRDAVRIVRPYAVDVASGVELEPSRKNEYLVREFIRTAVSA